MLSVDNPRACAERRARLSAALGSDAAPAVIAAGGHRPRNFPANAYPFRASSHFLYFVGAAIEDALLWVSSEQTCLLRRERPQAFHAETLWYGPPVSAAELGEQLGLPVRSLEDLADLAGGRSVACIGPVDVGERQTLAAQLGRPVDGLGEQDLDQPLRKAVADLRRVHDAAAIDGLRAAAAATVHAHQVGMAATRVGSSEQAVCAAMEGALGEKGCGVAYGSIVTTQGQILHEHRHHLPLNDGDLLLCDVGAETSSGWAGDVTRTWPVNGRFSGTQRAMYNLVLAAQRASIDLVRPGTRYRDVHLAACRVLTQGLVDEGVFTGSVDGLLERGVQALFFPHGVGHLLGLDVHDMEDLGDLAGYPPGRSRDPQFGLSLLRLDWDLCPGMAVTVEPGFYRIPALLADPQVMGLSLDDVDTDKLARFDDVNGIRIEDDVLVTADGHEVLTAALVKSAEDVEAAVGAT